MSVFEGVLKQTIESRMVIKVGKQEFPCTPVMFDAIRKHYQIGERIEIETNSEGRVKSVVSKETTK